MTAFARKVVQTIREKGGFGPVYERIASGETMTKIAPDYGCSRDFLRKILTKGEARARAFHNAQKDAAASHAEKGMQLLDDVREDKEAIMKARAQAEYRRWLASRLDRETFGDAPLVQLNAPQTFNQLFLDAARHSDTRALPPSAAQSSGPVLPAKEAEFVLLPSGD